MDHARLRRGLLRPLFYLKGVVSQQLRSMMAPGAEHSAREIIYFLYGSKYCKFATKKKSPWERQLPNSVASIRHCAWDCARFQANNGEVSVGGGRATDEHLALLLLLMLA